MSTVTRKRPKHLNLIQIRLPVPGIISIMHRVSGAVLFLLLPLMKRTLTISLDVDWFYRTLAPRFVRWIARDLHDLVDGVLVGTRAQVGAIIESVAHYHGPAGLLARTLPTGRSVFWALVILAAFLIFNLA